MLLLSNKSCEFNITRWEEWTHYFEFNISLTRRMDHAGFKFNIEICGFFVEFLIYDTRHWDYDKNNWCNYDDEKPKM